MAKRGFSRTYNTEDEAKADARNPRKFSDGSSDVYLSSGPTEITGEAGSVWVVHFEEYYG